MISFPAKAGVIQTSHIFIFSVVICEINFGNVNVNKSEERMWKL